MPHVAIKKNPFANRDTTPLYVSIEGEIVTMTFNPGKYRKHYLIDAGRKVRLSCTNTLMYGSYDLSGVFEYVDTVKYRTDEGFADTLEDAYRVRIIAKPGHYTLTKRGLTRLPDWKDS
jgi:hypothetical protein